MKLDADQERRLAALQRLAGRISTAEEKLDGLRGERAKLIDEAIAAGIPKERIAAAIGVNRSRIFAMLKPGK